MRILQKVVRSTILTLTFVLLWDTSGYSQGIPISLQIVSQPSLVFMTDQSSFTLFFSNFTSGSVTNIMDVNYNIMANDVTRINDVVLARLDAVFPDIALEAQFGSYVKRGGNAHLTASSPGPVTVTTQDVGLAHKVVEEGDGKLLDGTLTIRYQARALQNLAAGQYFGTLTVSFTHT